MTAATDLIAALETTFEDGHLSRGERKAFGALLAEVGADTALRATLRQRAFAMARSAARDGRDPLDWLEDVVAALESAPGGGGSEAYFSPGEDCRRAIAEAFGTSRSRVDVCVFTITDDKLSDAIIAAHRRGVKIRVVTDNEKAEDTGSDIVRLSRAGVPVAIDTSPAHMHHKFALVDGKELLTGSYNWTRSAFQENQENILVTRDAGVIACFQAEFERLWGIWGQ